MFNITRKKAIRFFASVSRFNLLERIPQSENAKQVLAENPGITFIGLYHEHSKQITLMPAMPKKNLFLKYNEEQNVTEGTDKDKLGNPLTAIEIEALNKKYKNFIPRRACIDGIDMWLESHKLVYERMIEKDDPSAYYGFSITRNSDGSMIFVGNSLSFNHNKEGSVGKTMCPHIQELIQAIIKDWFTDACRPVNKSRVYSPFA